MARTKITNNNIEPVMLSAPFLTLLGGYSNAVVPALKEDVIAALGGADAVKKANVMVDTIDDDAEVTPEGTMNPYIDSLVTRIEALEAAILS